MAVSFVFFDLDDTLLDHRRAERAALADCRARFPALAAHDLARLHEVYHAHNGPLWRDWAAGRVTKAELQRLRFARTVEALACDLDADALGAHYLDRYGAHWAWRDGAEAAFHAVARRYPVGLLTNGFVEQQRGKLARFPALEERAAAVVISEEVGAWKPHRALFDHAAALAGVPAPEILYVGDSLHADVEGAFGAGWQAAWFRSPDLRFEGDPAAAPPRTFVFADWAELLDRLGV